MFNLGYQNALLVADPDSVKDIMITKNAQVEKTGAFQILFKTAFGNAMAFGKGDEKWKDKRKAFTAAFSKANIEVFLDLLKDYVNATMDGW